jgi:hypothetical protein
MGSFTRSRRPRIGTLWPASYLSAQGLREQTRDRRLDSGALPSPVAGHRADALSESSDRGKILREVEQNLAAIVSRGAAHLSDAACAAIDGVANVLPITLRTRRRAPARRESDACTLVWPRLFSADEELWRRSMAGSGLACLCGTRLAPFFAGFTIPTTASTRRRASRTPTCLPAPSRPNPPR